MSGARRKLLKSARKARPFSLRPLENPTLLLGDCLEEMQKLPQNSIDTCITDPPYELGFMGKSWDSSGIAFNPDTWRAVYRVLKPGAFLLCFGGTRTFHRITCAIEDAAFEIAKKRVAGVQHGSAVC